MSLNLNRRDLLVTGGAIATMASMSGAALAQNSQAAVLAQNTPAASTAATPADTSVILSRPILSHTARTR